MNQILLIDDHPVMRLGLAALIRAEKDLKVWGEAGTAGEAMSLCEDAFPDLAIVDLTLPDKSGLELIKDLRARHPNLSFLVVSMHDEMMYAERVLRAGAKGYIMKQEAPEKLISAIRLILRGEVFLSAGVAARILKRFADAGGRAASPIERLTDRELEVFQLIGEGKGSREIAGMLNISVRTVDAHRAHIKEKLELRDSTELVHHAIRWVETGQLA
jgi:DNA-binding NarL/FixJ family response regulator